MADEEREKENTETENPYVTEDEQASTSSVNASNEAGEEETGEGKIPLTETPEFKRIVQVEKDKALATISKNSQREIKQLRADFEAAKQDLADREANLRWEGEQGAKALAWVEGGLPKDRVDAFQHAENILRRDFSAQRKRESEYAPKIQLAESYEAILKVLPDVLGDKGDLVQELVDAVSEGETLKEKTALAKLKALELKGKVTQPQTKPGVTHRPSTGQPSGAGRGKPLTAADVVRMSPDERYARREEISKIPLTI